MPNGEIATTSLLDQIIHVGRMVRDPSQTEHAYNRIQAFVDEVAAPPEADADADADAPDAEAPGAEPSVIAAIQQRIAEIDEEIATFVDAIMHDPEFQTLEADWRGLHYLVMNTETSTRLKLRLLNVSKKELHDDLTKAVDHDQSALFKKVYEEEYGTFGGHPFGLLVGGFEFGRLPPDFELLEKVSNVAAAAHAPFIAAADPTLFDMDSFTELGTPRDLAKIFESAELIKWRSFRESEDSRYVVLTLPKALLRLPYGPRTKPVDGLAFEEDVATPPPAGAEANGVADEPTKPKRYPFGTDHNKYLWGNTAFVLAQRITNAFAMYSWCAAIRGVEGGGIVRGLPTHVFRTGEGDLAIKCPTEVAITDRREKELDELGFVALVHCKGTDYAAFFGGHTANKPKLYNTDQANANARLSAMLPYLLAASRFAHYIKVMMRDKVGSFMSRINVEKYLNTWITDYVLLNDEASQSEKARFPLREARIDVTEVPGKPGSYRATVFLRPHFQLEELTASIRLVAELPPPAA